jgi:hypothetical protein
MHVKLRRMYDTVMFTRRCMYGGKEFTRRVHTLIKN